jgi:hypothetical protein
MRRGTSPSSTTADTIIESGCGKTFDDFKCFLYLKVVKFLNRFRTAAMVSNLSPAAAFKLRCWQSGRPSTQRNFKLSSDYGVSGAAGLRISASVGSGKAS